MKFSCIYAQVWRGIADGRTQAGVANPPGGRALAGGCVRGLAPHPADLKNSCRVMNPTGDHLKWARIAGGAIIVKNQYERYPP